MCDINSDVLLIGKIDVDDACTSSSVGSLCSHFPSQACRTIFGAGGNRRACGVIERAWLNYAISFLDVTESITAERANNEDVPYLH